jgi:hypothetical protein
MTAHPRSPMRPKRRWRPLNSVWSATARRHAISSVWSAGHAPAPALLRAETYRHNWWQTGWPTHTPTSLSPPAVPRPAVARSRPRRSSARCCARTSTTASGALTQATRKANRASRSSRRLAARPNTDPTTRWRLGRKPGTSTWAAPLPDWVPCTAAIAAPASPSSDTPRPSWPAISCRSGCPPTSELGHGSVPNPPASPDDVGNTTAPAGRCGPGQPQRDRPSARRSIPTDLTNPSHGGEADRPRTGRVLPDCGSQTCVAEAAPPAARRRTQPRSTPAACGRPTPVPGGPR